MDISRYRKRRRIAAVACSMAAIAAELVMLDEGVEDAESDEESPPRNTYLTQRSLLPNTLKSNKRCFEMLRMNLDCFRRFSFLFKASGRLHDTIHCSVDEQVVIFLHTIAFGVRNRPNIGYWQRSGETISRYFNLVLDAMLDMQDQFINRQPAIETHSSIKDSARWWPYFKDCEGAIDGTHIQAKVPKRIEGRFRGRKQWLSQNVLAACDFDLKFTMVLAGWEGSASDSRILASAISMENGIVCPPGKYYLADAGFPLLRHFITPFRSTRYHLNEIRGRVPESEKELFNHRHSCLRNAIERTFGVFKMRFNIINEKPKYSWEKQISIVLACASVHNFIRGAMPEDELLAVSDRHLLSAVPDPEPVLEPHISRVENGREGSRIRDQIMHQMWFDWQGHRRHRT